MLLPAKLNATYQDVLDAPEGMRAELIDGALYLQPRPRIGHQLALANLRDELSRGDQESGGRGWLILPEVEIHIPFTLVPDLAGWRRERVTEPLDAPYFTVTPDWVCEVLSPPTRAYDRGLKAQKYLDRGVGHLWLIDTDEQSLEVFVARADGWQLTGLYEGPAARGLEPFPGVALNLSRLWGR